MSEQKKKAPVGSRDRKRIRAEMQVPVNLERVLIEAGKDLAFYQALVADPASALADRGYRLRASEQAMLAAMPQTALQKMIEQLRPEKLTKSRFAKQVAAAVAGTMLFSTSACDSSDGPPPPTSLGITPEFTDASYSPTTGVAPDFPQDANSDTSTGGTGGVEGTGGDDSVYWGTGGTGVGPDWPRDAGSDANDVDTGPELLNDASSDGSQESDADEPIWEADSGTVTRGITPDFPGDASNDSSDSNNENGN